MIIFLAIFLIIIFYLIRKYKSWLSSYTLNFILGRKGSGKSTYMVYMILKYYKLGWFIYTDLNINLPYVRIIKAEDLKNFTPVPHSAVFLDEAGLTYDNRQHKNFDTGVRDWYALQRHYHCTVFLNSQTFDIDKKLRDRTDTFVYLSKIGPLSLIRPIVQTIKPNDMTTADCDNPVSAKYKWGSLTQWRILWLPKYQKYFDSFAIPPRDEIPFYEVPMDYALKLRTRRWILKCLNKRSPLILDEESDSDTSESIDRG